MFQLYKNIKELRIKRHYTQQQLAELVGYNDKGTISKIEKGQIDLSQSQIVKFAEALHTTPVDLMGWSTEEYSLSMSEQEIITLYREAPEAIKQSVKILLTSCEKKAEKSNAI